MTNHYETLGLKSTASQKEIEDAYQKLSKKFHPENNDADDYFSDLFRNIKEAYDVLSDKNNKAKYDNLTQTIKSESVGEKPKNIDPEILMFESNKHSFIEGDTIELKWKTRNTDKIIIKPFGELEPNGKKVFKLKNFNKPELNITLNASNSFSDKIISRTVILKNEVAEVDFSEFEKDEPVEEYVAEDNQQLQIENEPVHSNSFAGTAAVEYEESPVAKTEESFFSTNGRLRRSTYIGRAILLSLPILLLSFMAESTNDDSLYAILGILTIICVVLIFMQFIKRLHDVNLSGWWGLLNLIPYIGGLFGLIVIFIDSNRGTNQYGPDPKNRN